MESSHIRFWVQCGCPTRDVWPCTWPFATRRVGLAPFVYRPRLYFLQSKIHRKNAHIDQPMQCGFPTQDYRGMWDLPTQLCRVYVGKPYGFPEA